jgi:F-type H+-transporting ATPase subunit delta
MIEFELEAARPYAQALVAAARKEDQVENALAELEAVENEILAPNPQFDELLSSGEVPLAERDRILLRLLDGKISDLALRFVRVLNRHGRIGILGAVVSEARANWDRIHHRISVLVRSAQTLDADQIERLGSVLAQALGGEPMISVVVEPELIGGFVVQIGDDHYDASLRHNLENLRQSLIEGRTHEIQSRRDQFSYSE